MSQPYSPQDYQRNREAFLRRRRVYAARHPEKIKSKNARYRQQRPDVNRAHKAAHRARLLTAMPSWASKNEMQRIYDGASYLSRLTGIQFVVDHVIPLTSQVVCGLHVPANLQYLTRSANAKKRNKFAPSLSLQPHSYNQQKDQDNQSQ